MQQIHGGMKGKLSAHGKIVNVILQDNQNGEDVMEKCKVWSRRKERPESGVNYAARSNWENE